MANYHSFSPNTVEANQIDYYDTIELVSGDNQPELTIILKDSNTALSGQTLDAANHATWALINLTNASSVVMKFSKAETTTILETITCSIVSPPTNGKVIMTWGSTTLNGASGVYEGEITVTYSNGNITTVRDLLKFDVRAGF